MRNDIFRQCPVWFGKRDLARSRKWRHLDKIPILKNHSILQFRIIFIGDGIDYTDSENRRHSLNVLECVETHLDKQGNPFSTKYKWLTNFTLLSSNSPLLANRAGRVRWKIENEGFNMQKHGGFGLEHVYSQDENAGKIFCLLLQIAWTLFQLMTRSHFFQQAFPKGVGSLKNIAYRFLEAWRNLRLGEAELTNLWKGTFDTS
jgi:hypothetical protein